MCISEARVRDLWNIVEMFVEPFRILCVKRATLSLFANHSSVKREQIIFTLETMKRRQESGIGISFIDS